MVCYQYKVNKYPNIEDLILYLVFRIHLRTYSTRHEKLLTGNANKKKGHRKASRAIRGKQKKFQTFLR